MRWVRRLLVIVAVLVASTATAGSAATTGAPHASLAGTWKGVLTGTLNGKTQHERITLTINGRESAGTWKTGGSCHGKLTLDSISNGYHHYRRHLARGSTCSGGGDIDCLERKGANVGDTITPRPGGWQRSGTLRRWLPGLTDAKLAKLRAMVRGAAKANGDAHPSRVMVYASRRHEANIAAGAGTGVIGHQPVYLVVARGHFTCSSCSGPPNSTPPSGNFITQIVDRGTLQDLDFGIGDRVYTSKLGPGLPLQLGQA